MKPISEMLEWYLLNTLAFAEIVCHKYIKLKSVSVMLHLFTPLQLSTKISKIIFLK